MINKSVLLHCPPPAAFQRFTQRISEWWPKTHRLTKDADSSLFIEPGGRFWEKATDGREIDLGRVLVWDAPARLALDFFIGTNSSQPTALEVLFTAEGECTRVTIHHKAKPESEGLWGQRAPKFDQSWDAVLAALANA